MTTRLDYISGSIIIPEGSFGISPSSISSFISAPHQWYREFVLGERDFSQSTATVLGTICHFIAEEFVTKKSVDKLEIYKYIYKHTCPPSISFPTTEDLDTIESFLYEHCLTSPIDGQYILSQWKVMGNTLITYLKNRPPVAEVENMIAAEILPNFYAAGSADKLEGPGKGKGFHCLTDYKTTSDLTPKDYIPMNYKYQLLTYAWIYTKLGYNVDRIRIVWITNNQVGRISETTGKPLKDYPSQVVEVTELINQQDLDFIESILKLISETVQAARDYPHLTHCLFKDYRLKQE